MSSIEPSFKKTPSTSRLISLRVALVLIFILFCVSVYGLYVQSALVFEIQPEESIIFVHTEADSFSYRHPTLHIPIETTSEFSSSSDSEIITTPVSKEPVYETTVVVEARSTVVKTIYATRTASEQRIATSVPSRYHVPLLGVHANKLKNLKAFEEYLDVTVDYVAVHIHWGNEKNFPTEFAKYVKERGATLVIFWNPMDYRKSLANQYPFHYQEILSGAWDSYINSFIDSIRSYGSDVIIAPFEEINGFWVPWSGATGVYGSVGEYIQTYQYLREKFRNVPHVQFAWVVNHVSVPNVSVNKIFDYYPGDTYVDIIGINAFNFGSPWIPFDTLVHNAISELAVLKKPMLITSTASASGKGKNDWIEKFRTSAYFTSGKLIGWIWFNENKERNWLIWSDDPTYTD